MSIPTTHLEESSLTLNLDATSDTSFTSGPEAWIKGQKGSPKDDSQVIVVIESDPMGHSFQDLAEYLLHSSPEARSKIHNITLAGITECRITLSTHVLSKIILSGPDFLPNLRRLTLQNLTIEHTGDTEIPAVISLQTLSMKNICGLSASGVFWILGHFKRLQSLLLGADVELIDTDDIPQPLDIPKWVSSDGVALRLPRYLEIETLEVRNPDISNLCLYLIHHTASLRSLKSIAIAFDNPDTFIAFGVLLMESSENITTMTLDVTDCTRLGVRGFDGQYLYYGYTISVLTICLMMLLVMTDAFLQNIASCSSLQHFTIGFYISVADFSLNSAVWDIVVKTLQFIPLEHISQININFETDETEGVPWAAIELLDWDAMQSVLMRFVADDRQLKPTLNLFTRLGFTKEQVSWIVDALWLVSREGTLYMNQDFVDLGPSGLVDEVAESEAMQVPKDEEMEQDLGDEFEVYNSIKLDNFAASL